MKLGTENRRQTIILGVVGVIALATIYPLYEELFGGPPPATAAPPVIRDAAPPVTIAAAGGARVLPPSQEADAVPAAPLGNRAAVRVGSTAQSLDPTLHMDAMLRTESLVYEGSGRNIFSGGTSSAPSTAVRRVVIPPPIQPARPGSQAPGVAINQGPPGPPPINLKFFGTATSPNGTRRAFLLNGDNVFLASIGDVVDRRYKVVSISINSILIEDLPNTNRQSLPLLTGN